MELTKTNAPVTTITRNLGELESQTGNVYEAIAIMGKRANQISTVMKQELDAKLAEFASVTDSLEEIFENREQIEISKMYERLPKPSSIATQEYIEGKIYFRRPEEEQSTSAE